MPEDPKEWSHETLGLRHEKAIPEAELAPVQRLDAIGYENGVRRTDLRIEGMDCPDEVELLERALKPLPGVRSVEANILASRITIVHDPATDTQRLIEAIQPTGLKAARAEEVGREEATGKAQRARWLSVGTSGAFTTAGLLMGWLRLGPEPAQIACYMVAIISGGWFIFPKAVAAAGQLRLDMNVLMTVAIAGAAFIGEWSEAAAVVFLFALSEMLEAVSVNRARRAIQSLMKLTPLIALVQQKGGAFQEVPVSEVTPGAVVAVKSGQRIPLDGEISSGTSPVNQAPITGESMPVDKDVGDQVFAGTINGAGALEIRVTKPASDTMLARIIHLVEEAQTQ
jgi:Cd2+/Zn2+-exporting ATPase